MEEAIAIVETDGAENLSLREISRRLDVSHQAPYKHFRSREDLLWSVVLHGFSILRDALAPAADESDPSERITAIYKALHRFAQLHGGLYRLMFLSALPPDSAQKSDRELVSSVFKDLCETVADLVGAPGTAEEDLMIQQEAAVLWSVMHGAISLSMSNNAAMAVRSKGLVHTATLCAIEALSHCIRARFDAFRIEQQP
ncbi:MAG: TetR/AcrR family transcriptional regulator [Neomegalonema sp.]|nr:TetR/AcrR family transcriptional regulator [Neomegalonema sp.]